MDSDTSLKAFIEEVLYTLPFDPTPEESAEAVANAIKNGGWRVVRVGSDPGYHLGGYYVNPSPHIEEELR